MRWERLFSDLETQWQAEERRELDVEVADRTRRARAEVGLFDRLCAHVGGSVTVVLATGQRLDGRLHDVGTGWLLLEGTSGHPHLVPLGAVMAVTGPGAATDPGATARRFGLGYALRGLSRDRTVVAVTDASGRTVTGTVDAVGSDVLDLAEHAADEVRREGNVRSRRLIPFTAIVCVRGLAAA